jgi:hypothetical protein
LYDFCLDAQVSQLVTKSLCLNTQLFSLLFANLDFFFKHDAALDSHIILGLDILKRRRLIACLTLEIVALHFDISEAHLQRALALAQCGNLFLQGILRIVRFGFALLVLCLQQC